MKTRSYVELLESRIAPAAIYHFTDVDGDLVTIKTSKGTDAQLAARAGALMPPSGLGNQLGNYTLTPEFDGTDISITARPQLIGGVLHGDGFVNVGAIDIGSGKLGKVTVHGDLGRIIAGDGTATPAVKSLTVQSLGRLGTSTGAPDLVSSIAGAFGALHVKGDVVGANIHASAIGRVNVSGSLLAGAGADSGEIFSSGNMGPVKIGHDVVGGAMGRSGLIESEFGTIASVTIGGSLIGGGSSDTGEIYSLDNLGVVKIGHDVKGGTGAFSGIIKSRDGKVAGVFIGGSLIGGASDAAGVLTSGLDMGKVRIGGDVRGGTGLNSGLVTSGGVIKSVVIGGSVTGGTMQNSGSVTSAKAMGPAKIGGDLKGGAGANSGRLFSGTGMSTIAIGGSLLGGAGFGSGSLTPFGSIGVVSIGHDVIGGIGNGSGSVSPIGSLAGIIIGGSVIGGSASSGVLGGTGSISPLIALGFVKIGGDLIGGNASGSAQLSNSGNIDVLDGGIASIFIGGSIIAGTTTSSIPVSYVGSIAASEGTIGSLVVKGSIVGNATHPVMIASAHEEHPTATHNLAFGSINIGNRVEFANILAGYNNVFVPVNGNAQVGAVKVGGDWIASSLVAGVQHAGATGFGDGTDTAIGTGTISRIASITIGGQVLGQLGTNNTFGFGAGKIGSFKVGGVSLALKSGAHNDRFTGVGVAGNALPIGPSLSNKVGDGFAVHVFEV